MNRDEILRRAQTEHDQGCNCDPRYVMSCPRMAAAVLRCGRNNSTETDAATTGGEAAA